MPPRQPPKRKPTGKVFKVKPKLGCRTFAQQLSDYTVIALILVGVAMLGRYFQSKKDAAHGHGEEHEHAEHRRLGHHAVDPILDMQASLAICVVLISVTIIFETVKHKLEHDVPPMMQGVLQAMFGELTVLGFIALYAYFMLRLGVLGWISTMVYGDDEHLVHLFEDIHFMLFFVMILFLIEACILVVASLKCEKYWISVENLISSNRSRPADKEAAPPSYAPVAAQLAYTYKAGRKDCCRRFCFPRIVWSYREAEAREELRYALLRDRFITPPSSGAVAQAGLPTDFDFSSYLRRQCAHLVAHSLHVSVNTWLVVIAYLSLIIEVPTLETKYHLGEVGVMHVIGLGWALWLLCCLFQAKLDAILDSLTPRHPLLKPSPRSRSHDEEAPTSALLSPADALAPYELRKAKPKASKHEQLFWMGRKGPALLVFLMRILMLLSAVSVAVIWTWLTTHPEDTYLLLIGLLPVLDVVVCAPQYYLPAVVLSTSIEMMKKQSAITDTTNEMKTERALKMLKMLNTLSAQARRAQKLQKAQPGAGYAAGRQRGAAKPRELEPAQEEELRQAFELFDKDASGFIDKDELAGLMQTLGVTLDEVQLANLYTEMDPSGDGQIDFKEFCEAMARDPEEQQSTLEMATAIFAMLDKSGDGKVSTAEMKSAMVSMNPSLSDEDINAAMSLFDKDGTGNMSKQEFVQGVETMKTFV